MSSKKSYFDALKGELSDDEDCGTVSSATSNLSSTASEFVPADSSAAGGGGGNRFSEMTLVKIITKSQSKPKPELTVTPCLTYSLDSYEILKNTFKLKSTLETQFSWKLLQELYAKNTKAFKITCGLHQNACGDALHISFRYNYDTPTFFMAYHLNGYLNETFIPTSITCEHHKENYTVAVFPGKGYFKE